MSFLHVVVIDDELPNLESLGRVLRGEGFHVSLFQKAREAVEEVRRGGVDLILTDLRMQTMSGLDVLETVKAIDPTIEIILMTAYGTVQVAVDAMKKGAYDFVTKPLKINTLHKTLKKASEKRKLSLENQSLREELRRSQDLSESALVGNSPAFREMMDLCDKAAASMASVLVEGESGTGKGMIAEYLHQKSHHHQGLLVKINCTSIPENLLEAELFGFEAGAFTDAKKQKKGRVELAEKGTLFLDEIGIAPQALQAKLLRFVQDGEFERLGGTQTQTVSTRVISATNNPLKQATEKGIFREDLYYRLNVIHIEVPPLRERSEDIELLTKKFLVQLSKKNHREVPLITPEALSAMKAYPWPGNVRQLQNLVERLVVLNQKGIIHASDLPVEFNVQAPKKFIAVPIGLSLKQVESMVFQETLKNTQGDKKKAAHLLGVHPRTLHRHFDSKQES